MHQPSTINDQPILSVCMATHNGARYLRRQLETILPQLHAGDELVISDDSSTDGTLDIIGEFHDNRIRLFAGNTFFSPIFNFENALKEARGDVLVLADQDDVWLENRLDLIRRTWVTPPAPVYLVALDGYVADEDEKLIVGTIFEKLKAGRGFCKNLVANRYQGCCLAFSRHLLDLALPFPRQLPMHDMWLGMVGEIWGRTDFIAEKTIIYRKHPDSFTDFRIRFAPVQQIRWRLLLVYCLLKRWLHVGWPA